jgi:RHS repeat-associated protein
MQSTGRLTSRSTDLRQTFGYNKVLSCGISVTSWQVRATADFDRNRTPHLVYQNTGNAQVNVDYYTTTYTYDNNGNLLTKTDANTNKTTLSYDALNRATSKTYTFISGYSTPNVTYCYDGNPQGACANAPSGSNDNLVGHATLVSATLSGVPISSTSYGQYDTLGNVLQSTQITGREYPFTYTYNLANAMLGMTLPSGRTLTWTYDSANRIASAGGTPPGGTGKTYASSMIYASQGPIKQFNLGNGLVEVRSYDTYRQQLTGVSLGPNGSTLNLGFDYCTGTPPQTSCTNNNGNLQSQTISPLGVTQNYTYDSYNRLSTSGEKAGTTTTWSENFNYDSFGNRWVLPNPVGITLSPWTVTTNYYNSATNRLTYNNFGYDNGGNQTTISPYTVSYDVENRQSGFTSTSNGSATYTYDGDGRRVEKTAGGVTTTYVYDATGNLAAEYSSQPPSMSCQTCYLTTDHLGSTRVITSQTGGLVSRHDFLPFGEELATSNRTAAQGYGVADNVMQRYTGQQRDLEGPVLDYFHARYFQGAQGRFTGTDPDNAGALPGDPQLWNGYSYARNNPESRVYPSGLSSIIIDGVQSDRPFGIFGSLGSNGLAGCPNNACNGYMDSGRYFQFTSGAGDSGAGYTAYQTTSVSSTVFGQTTATTTTFPVFVPTTVSLLPSLGSLIGTVVRGTGFGLVVGLMLMQDGSSGAARAKSNPFVGQPGTTSTIYQPDGTPKQVRRYGSDGFPETDVDYDHDHTQGKPHVHDWGRPAGGGPPTNEDRGGGRSPKPSDPKPTPK